MWRTRKPKLLTALKHIVKSLKALLESKYFAAKQADDCQCAVKAAEEDHARAVTGVKNARRVWLPAWIFPVFVTLSLRAVLAFAVAVESVSDGRLPSAAVSAAVKLQRQLV